MAGPASLRRFHLEGVRDTGRVIGEGAYAVVKELEFRGLKCVGKKLHAVLYENASRACVREFSSEEVKTATGDLSDSVGKGGFGTVYRGTFHHIPVAVKVLNAELDVSGTGLTIAVRLQKEVQALTRFRHPNLIQLMGFSKSPPSIVMPFMERGSLYQCLHQFKMQSALTWSERVGILVGSACGLAYLHSSRPPFVHHDVKSQNILLDERLEPVLADFGFVAPMPSTIGSTTVVTAAGTSLLAWSRGYQAPELSDGKHGPPIDIYSYGVVVLETFTGLVAYNDDREDEQLIYHCADALSACSLENLRAIADRKAGSLDSSLATTVGIIARGTTCRKYKQRMTMDKVIEQWKQ